MRTASLIALAAAMGLLACGAPQTAAWYAAHPDRMQRRIDQCLAAGEATSDCRAAKNAYLRLHGMKEAY